MNSKKQKALISKNPTFDLKFISGQFESSQQIKQYRSSIDKISKCLSQRKIIKSLENLLDQNSPRKYQQVKTQQNEDKNYRTISLPKLNKMTSLKSFSKKQKNMFLKNEQKINEQNEVLRKQINRQLGIMETQKFAFNIKKYGHWLS